MPIPAPRSVRALRAVQNSYRCGLALGACLGMKNIGKPCAGKPHARFDEGGQASACPLLYRNACPNAVEQCPQCGSTLKIIAAIEHPPVIAKILTHLGLSARAPPGHRPVTRAAIRSIPNGLIPNRYPIQCGSAPISAPFCTRTRTYSTIGAQTSRLHRYSCLSSV